MRKYRITYSTKYQNKCSRKIWQEPPKGLQSARLGAIVKSRLGKKTKVPVIAICKVEGKLIRKTKNVFLRAEDVRNIRLRLIDIPD